MRENAGLFPDAEHPPQQAPQTPGRFHVKLIEHNAQQCLSLASALPSEVLVLEGDATDEDVLQEEGIEEVLDYGTLSPLERSELESMLPTLHEEIQVGLDFARE